MLSSKFEKKLHFFANFTKKTCFLSFFDNYAILTIANFFFFPISTNHHFSSPLRRIEPHRFSFGQTVLREIPHLLRYSSKIKPTLEMIRTAHEIVVSIVSPTGQYRTEVPL